MRISPINNVYQNNNSFKAKKPVQSVISKVAEKALLPTAICAYVFSPLLGAQTKQDKEFNQVQYQKEFVMDGKDYTMSFVNTSKYFGEDAVSEIYFTPQDTTLAPMRLESMTKYVSDDGYSVGVTVSESDSISYEIKLPKQIGDELLNLYDGETDLFVVPGLNTYSEVNAD